MQKVLFYTGYNRWLKRSEEFVRSFDLSILINNNPQFFADKSHLFFQTINLSENLILPPKQGHHPLAGRIFPTMEKYSIAIGLIEPYLTGGIIKKDSLIYFGHTDTQFTKMEDLLEDKENEWFVWAWPRADVDPDLFHSDAFLLNLSIMDLSRLHNFFLYRSSIRIYEEITAESRITRKIKTTSNRIKILGIRGPKGSFPELGFYHIHPRQT